jgi:hypothetical protein
VETVAFERFREAFLAGDADKVAAAFAPDAAYATNAGMLLIESLVVNKRP